MWSSVTPFAQVTFFLLASLLVLGGCGGCATFSRKPNSAVNAESLTLVLPGIEGDSLLSKNMVHGLIEGGVAGHVESYDWTTGQAWRSLEHLTDWEQSDRQADLLAARIVDFQRANPGHSLNLVGHSGGAALCLLAVQRLPAPHRVHRIVLLAPAISTEFPIDEALSNCDCIFLFTSPWDFQLTTGTKWVGTLDRDFRPAAGSRGFSSQDPRLIELPFRPAMMLDGHWGGHVAVTNRRFVREWVAPLLATELD